MAEMQDWQQLLVALTALAVSADGWSIRTDAGLADATLAAPSMPVTRAAGDEQIGHFTVIAAVIGKKMGSCSGNISPGLRDISDVCSAHDFTESVDPSGHLVPPGRPVTPGVRLNTWTLIEQAPASHEISNISSVGGGHTLWHLAGRAVIVITAPRCCYGTLKSKCIQNCIWQGQRTSAALIQFQREPSEQCATRTSVDHNHLKGHLSVWMAYLSFSKTSHPIFSLHMHRTRVSFYIPREGKKKSIEINITHDCVHYSERS